MTIKNTNRRFVPKGWGWEDWLCNSPRYCGKLLFVKKGKKCSWHFHREKDETFHVHSGAVFLRYLPAFEAEHFRGEGLDEAWIYHHCAHKVILSAGDTFHVPSGMLHQFEALGDTYLYEFSTEHKDEDSIRVIQGD